MTNETLRLRIFAGPNGSGKSTIINSVRNYKNEKGAPLDFGIYINADDIAQELKKDGCLISRYKIHFDLNEFIEITLQSGLIGNHFNENEFKNSFLFEKNKLKSTNQIYNEYLAQIIANYLRIKFLQEKRKFSFETVFSHEGKVQFMKQAKDLGYKVYLYFVSTENPEINIYRVKEVRVKQKGHDVPIDKIRTRYDRSMDLLFSASQFAYRCYYFDNSSNGKSFNMFANFKINKDGKKHWEIKDENKIPRWFYKYYSDKVSK